MSWIEDAQKAINYIENNLFENISVDDVANHLHYSSNHLQKMFNIATGLSITDYIKNRRLSIAGQELINTKAKVIDMALKYGYLNTSTRSQ